MAELLAQEQIADELTNRPTWSAEGNALVRAVECQSFPRAIEAVNRIAEIAEELDHHPDIDIRWRNLRLSLSTHSLGGITAKDLLLADRIDAVIGDYARN